MQQEISAKIEAVKPVSKQAYVKPEATELGSVEAMTQIQTLPGQGSQLFVNIK